MNTELRLIHQHATKRTAGLYRTWVFGIWFAVIFLAPIAALSNIPELAPYGVGMLYKYLPLTVKYQLYTPAMLWGIKITLLLTSLCVIFRVFAKTAGIIFCLMITIYEGMIRGIAHVHHSELVMMYAAYLFVLFEIADSISNKDHIARKNEHLSPHGSPLIAILTVLCFTYTFIGLHRLVYGGLDIFVNNSLIYWIIENSNEPKLFNFWPVDHLFINHQWLRFMIKLGFPVCTLIEILAPFSLISRPFRIVFIVVMLSFHVFNWLFMGILFLENMLLFVLFFEPRQRGT